MDRIVVVNEVVGLTKSPLLAVILAKFTGSDFKESICSNFVTAKIAVTPLFTTLAQFVLPSS